jgi:hypothetical protein
MGKRDHHQRNLELSFSLQPIIALGHSNHGTEGQVIPISYDLILNNIMNIKEPVRSLAHTPYHFIILSVGCRFRHLERRPRKFPANCGDAPVAAGWLVPTTAVG